MSNNLVLGHSGFLGQALMRQIDGAKGLSSADVDLLRPESVDKLAEHFTPDTTLILAAALTPDKGNNLDRLNDNVTISLHVAKCMEKQPLKRCVLISTDAVYPMQEGPISEETPVSPEGPYPVGKYTAERVLDVSRRPHKIPLLVLRSTALYGPGDPHGSYGPNRFVKTQRADGEIKLFGEGEETRDHLHVEDAANLIARLVEAETEGVFNLATGESPSFMEIAELVKAQAGSECRIVTSPRKNPVTHRRFDISRLKDACPGISFRSLEKGIQEMLA